MNFNKYNQNFIKNKLPFFYMQCKSQADKYKLAEFVYDNTDNFVMNTFALLWENRQLWCEFPPLVMFDDKNNIIGMHAFAVKEINNKNYLKTYYIVTDKQHRGQGIAKKLTLQVMNDLKDKFTYFYVNSVEGSDGERFYRKIITNRPKKKINEFNTQDYIFTGKITKILDKNT